MKRSSRAAASLEQAGRDLIAAANEAGGRDNITVILFRLEDVDGGAGAPRPATRPSTRRGRATRSASRARARRSQ